MAMIHEITSTTPRNKRSQRKGRGESSGRGKTCGKGNKGSKARVGGPYWKPGHEGGQTPLFRRLPKRGFSNYKYERRFHIVNLADLERFDNGTTVDAIMLKEAGLVSDTKQPVKILGNGEISKKLTIVAGWFSKSAHEKISKAGGAAQNLKGETFEFPRPKKRFVPRVKDQQGGGKKKKQQQVEAAPAEAAAPAEGSAPATEAPKSE